MRTVKFQDVLWNVANKMGLDPYQSNFLSNQAIPIGTYVNQWVRRLYDLRDWPEWVMTHRFAPVNHVVPWDAPALDVPAFPGDIDGVTVRLGRILKVYLTDPAQSNGASVSTVFTILEDGVHCGYEHGGNVWIRYIPTPPTFTAVPWDGDTTYQKDDVTYSATNGECYRSRSGGNVNNDPWLERTPLTPVVTQDFDPGVQGNPEQTKKMRLLYGDVQLFGATSSVTQVTADVFDPTGLLVGTSLHTVVPGDTLGSVFADITTQLDTALPGTWTVTQDTTGQFVEVTNASDFTMLGALSHSPPGISYMTVSVAQVYLAAVTHVAPQRELVAITLGSNQIVQGATYTLIIRDSTGHAHTASYLAGPYDGANEILNGLAEAMITEGNVDPWFKTVWISVDTTLPQLTLGFNEDVSVDGSFAGPTQQWWDLVEFPAAIAEQVVTGAYADLLKEWGQTDKGAAEEGRIPSETAMSEANFTTTPQPALSGQQSPLSRYKV